MTVSPPLSVSLQVVVLPKGIFAFVTISQPSFVWHIKSPFFMAPQITIFSYHKSLMFALA